MSFKAQISFVFCFLILFSCKKKQNEEAPDLGYDYYPDKVGNYIEYDIDSTAYTALPMDTIYAKFRIKELIDSVFTDNQGRATLRVIRYKKNYSSTVPYSAMSWTLQDVWMANKTKTTAEVVEENIRYVKLSFPVNDGLTWNGNAQNTLGEWTYKYSQVDQALTLNTLSFDKTVLVTQRNALTAISDQYYVEKYARGVGLIYKQIIDVKSTNVNLMVPILNRISEGIVYKQTVVDYHVN